MTNLEALQASLMYPVEEAKLKKALFDRDLDHLDDYIKSNKRLVDLAMADTLVIMINTPQIQEGGFQMALTDKSNLMKVASAIYLKYGEMDPFANTPFVSGISPW